MTFTNNYCKASSVSPASSKYLPCKRKNDQRTRFYIASLYLFQKKKKKERITSQHVKSKVWKAAIEIMYYKIAVVKRTCKGTQIIGSFSLKRHMMKSFTSLRISHQRYSTKKMLKILQYPKKITCTGASLTDSFIKTDSTIVVFENLCEFLETFKNIFSQNALDDCFWSLCWLSFILFDLFYVFCSWINFRLEKF